MQVMDARLNFGRKHFGHPFRQGLAPHVIQPGTAGSVPEDNGQPGAAPRRPHPFRAALPETALWVMPTYEPEVALAMARAQLRSKPLDPRLITLQDVKDFLLAYCACFLAVLAFIS